MLRLADMPTRVCKNAMARWNRDVLAQALTLTAWFDAHPATPFEYLVGPHLRHVIEHYEAFLTALAGPPRGGFHEIAYDDRRRDRAVERSASLAQARIEHIRAALADLPDDLLHAPVTLRLCGGVAGETEFGAESTPARELSFLASHAVHHFALLHGYCLELGIAVGADFGKASATCAHELEH